LEKNIQNKILAKILLFILSIQIDNIINQSLLGTWGPSLAGMALLPSIAGAVIVVSVVSFFLGKKE